MMGLLSAGNCSTLAENAVGWEGVPRKRNSCSQKGPMHTTVGVCRDPTPQNFHIS